MTSSSAWMVFMFVLYLPVGVLVYPVAALVIFALAALACLLAIRPENKQYFTRPLQELQAFLDDFKSER
ncbi:hypothetical protein K3G39_13455 [Pontibacter sp. HSC-14F20]|uniref:hypothetical protein n=1 Tax=Pontibacter sp. HSC-14F20 TaxID=2864136 RepID=UPI001C7328E5|nr:hypothetical protein [Pontibacter sp. HSC-14F20]MBX0334244.1 hypothetical protein [Pontibacter sp. HSC-14F20]